MEENLRISKFFDLTKMYGYLRDFFKILLISLEIFFLYLRYIRYIWASNGEVKKNTVTQKIYCFLKPDISQNGKNGFVPIRNLDGTSVFFFGYYFRWKVFDDGISWTGWSRVRPLIQNKFQTHVAVGWSIFVQTKDKILLYTILKWRASYQCR